MNQNQSNLPEWVPPTIEQWPYGKLAVLTVLPEPTNGDTTTGTKRGCLTAHTSIATTLTRAPASAGCTLANLVAADAEVR